METLKPGDRFENKFFTGFILEHLEDGKQVLISNSDKLHGYPEGKVSDWFRAWPRPTVWVYLGNFAKSNNVKTLYDKLNG